MEWVQTGRVCLGRSLRVGTKVKWENPRAFYNPLLTTARFLRGRHVNVRGSRAGHSGDLQFPQTLIGTDKNPLQSTGQIKPSLEV